MIHFNILHTENIFDEWRNFVIKWFCRMVIWRFDDEKGMPNTGIPFAIIMGLKPIGNSVLLHNLHLVHQPGCTGILVNYE